MNAAQTTRPSRRARPLAAGLLALVLAPAAMPAPPADGAPDADLAETWRRRVLESVRGQGSEAPGPPEASGSPWYLERGRERRDPGPRDAVPAVAFKLQALMRDGGVPGFYDGQFDSTRGDFEALAALVGDRDVHHVLRFVAVMALQESDCTDAELEHVLSPLVLPPQVEWDIEYQHYDIISSFVDLPAGFIPILLDAQLSRYSRFALAKRGLPDLIREKIAVMEHYVEQNRDKLPRGLLGRRRNFRADWIKETWFNIGYYYQQFDDYENASRWFRSLADTFPGDRSTRWAHYNLACMEALQGRPEQAVAELRKAYQAGFLDLAWMEEDGDLASLRDREDYARLRREMAVGDALDDPAGTEAPTSPAPGESPTAPPVESPVDGQKADSDA